MTLSPRVREVIQFHKSNHEYNNFKHHILQTSMLGSVKKKKNKKRKGKIFFFLFLLPTYHSHLTLLKTATVIVLYLQVFNFPYEKRTKPTNLRLNLLAQSSISLINKVQENRSIAMSERFFPFVGVLSCANSCLLRTWNDLKERASISSVCSF